MMIVSVAVVVEEVHQRTGEEEQVGRVAQEAEHVAPVFAQQPKGDR
jgi:hypothetical protein